MYLTITITASTDEPISPVTSALVDLFDNLDGVTVTESWLTSMRAVHLEGERLDAVLDRLRALKSA